MFDVDDTLCNTGTLHEEAFMKTLAKFGFQDFNFNYELLKGMRTEEVFMKFTKDSNLVRSMTIFKRETFRNISERTIACEGAQEILHFLRDAGVTVAAVSSGSNDSVLASLKRANLLELMDEVFTQENFKYQKPDPYPYTYAREKLKLETKDCLIVEDSEAGVKSGLASKMMTALVARHHPIWAEDLDLIHVEKLANIQWIVTDAT